MSFNEADVRDSLADRLDLLEPGLKLIEKERHLANAVGARGFIDVFARDRFGNFVVIEVKRSDQTARQAIQEVLKYAELLQREDGIAPHRIRLIIASTDWHELRVPFSAFARLGSYALSGVQLTVSDTGEVLAVAPVAELPAMVRGQLAIDAIVFLWRHATGRDAAWAAIEPHLQTAGLDDVLGLELDHDGRSDRIVQPYGLAILPARMSLDRARAAGLLGVDDIAPGIGPEDIADGLTEEDGPSLESEALAQLVELVPDIWNTAEALTPEKLAAEFQKGWTVSRLRRTGSFAAADYVDDDELVAQTQGFEGVNRIVLRVSSSPAVRTSWEEHLLNAQMVLEGNDKWQTGLLAWLAEREAEEPRDFSITIYHLADMLRALTDWAVNGSPRYMDALHVVRQGSDSEALDLTGILIWNGGGTDAVTAATEVFGTGPTDLLLGWGTAASIHQHRLLEALDLKYALLERQGNTRPMLFDGEGARRRPVTEAELDSFGRFLETRSVSILAMAQALAGLTVGLFDQDRSTS